MAMCIDEVDENEDGDRTFGFEVENGYLVVTQASDGLLWHNQIRPGGAVTLQEIKEAQDLVEARLNTEARKLAGKLHDMLDGKSVAIYKYEVDMAVRALLGNDYIPQAPYLRNPPPIGHEGEMMVQPRYTWSTNHESDNDLAGSPQLGERFPGYRHACGKAQGEFPPCRIDHSYELGQMRPGSQVTHYAGAPGTGSVTYEITRIDEHGAWGTETTNTMRELTAEEVR